MCVCPSVHPYARMEQLGSHWLDLLKLNMSIFRNPVEKVQASLKYDMYEGWNFDSGNYLFTTDTK